MPLTEFHPTVAAWFRERLGSPTEVQRQAWPAIRAGRHALIAAPTGSGKTLAAFLAAIDALIREGLQGPLPDTTLVLYISPLRALSNDIHKNLDAPLSGVRDELLMSGLADVPLRAQVRTGDTPAGERARMRRQPPHILVTTPESLYILLTSASGRRMLAQVRSVIVDEIHALAGNKRGAHLMLSLERLVALCRTETGRAPQRIGLSATQKPLDEIARYLVGTEENTCAVIDTGHKRARDLGLVVPSSPLEAVMAAEVWSELYARLEELILAHRTTLIFVNTRRLAERVARHLAERLGEVHITAHHGSLAREHRLDAEQRLKSGKLRALVTTTALELGIDIGDVDLVCQLGSPRSIAAFLQRVGRSGHAVEATPKGRLFPLSRDDLVECAALLDAIRHDELDRILIPHQPLDVLAQQIVAEVASCEWDEAELYNTLRRAWPYRTLSLDDYHAVVRMLSEGYSTRRGRRGAYLHRDAVNGRLRPRRGARLVAITNGGAIPDLFDYDVILQPEGHSIGSLNEDFAFESLPGDIFQLGNTSYRILKIEQGKVFVEDARGQPPNIPFWFGEAPGRSDELSHAVSRLRENIAAKLAEGVEAAVTWLQQELRLPATAAQPMADYLAAAQAALGVLPTQETIVLERFFDETGDMHLVIHAPYGSRLNRAWGLSLRKRFCRKFNFELQAAALEDSIVLSLGPTHSFPLIEVADYLKAASVRQVLIQALLDAPLFESRWRWCCNIALAVPRNRNGKRVPAQWQRSAAQDLAAVVFPDQLACLENIAGDREIPDHPLVQQTLQDCLHEAMDIAGLERLLTRIEDKQVTLLARDLTAPSPLAQEILGARPYAFLDDAPAEERRTLAVQQRRYLDPHSATDLGRLDPAAIARVRAEAWPEPRTPDELHDALHVLGFITAEEGARAAATTAPSSGWQALLDSLIAERRATKVTTPQGACLWVAAERLAELLLVYPQAQLAPPIESVGADITIDNATGAHRELLRSRLEGLGPVTASDLAASLGITPLEAQSALLALEQEGYAMRGRYTPDALQEEWCERGLLARIHRYTVQQLRREIEPVSPADFMRFLFRWQRLTARGEGIEALAEVLLQLEGCTVPAAAWERDILPARIDMYFSTLLDGLCSSGRYTWLRPQPPRVAKVSESPDHKARKQTPVRATPIALLPRMEVRHWRHRDAPTPDPLPLSSAAHKVVEVLREFGAAFFIDLVQHSGMLRTQVENALAELAAWGMVTSDSYAGLRALIAPASKRAGYGRHSRRGAPSLDHAGRWELLRSIKPDSPRAQSKDDARPPQVDDNPPPVATSQHVARVLLRRYGVVFRALLERESGLPPWRDLLYEYRRLEARGEIRGGRFVSGFSGEQFALPEAVGSLRELRNQSTRDETERGDKQAQVGESQLITIAATDPLNLTGIITPGARIPAQIGNRVTYRNGTPVAALVAKELRWLTSEHKLNQSEIRDQILRRVPQPTRRSMAGMY